MKNIRNFCIIAHIDHGKSTLADRLLEFTKTIDSKNPLILAESNLNNFRIENFIRERDKEPENAVPTFSAGKMKPVDLTLDGKIITVGHNERVLDDGDSYNEILFTALKD